MKKIIACIYFSLCFSQVDTTITINASSYDAWIYFSFEIGDIVDIDNSENSLLWDIAFKRNHIKTNSGLSGSGNGGAFVDTTQIWTNNLFESTQEILDDINYEIDEIILGTGIQPDPPYEGCYDPIYHMFVDCIKNPALDQWGWFDSDYYFNITNYMLIVKSADGGEYIKFWPYSYYSPNGPGGYITFRYEMLLNSSSNCDISIGDVNNDNIINVVDVIGIVNYILSIEEFNECEQIAADFNEDQIIDVIDVIAIVDLILN